MPKKTTLLIVVLAIVTAVLLFLAINQSGKQNNPPQVSTTPTETPVVKSAKVFFNPTNIDLSAGSSATPTSVDIMVDSGGQDIAGVQAELEFSPQALTNVKLVPAADATGFFGTGANVLFNDVYPTTGRISFAIAIGPTQSGKKGVGKIATLTFQKGFGATTSATTINFLDKTLVTIPDRGESALKDASPLNITLTSTTNVVPQISTFQTTTAPQVTTAPPTQ